MLLKEDLYSKCSDSINNEIPKVKKEIENDFREIFGIINN